MREEVGRDEKRSRGCRREGDSGARGAAVAWASAKQATTVPVYRGSNVLGRSALQQLPHVIANKLADDLQGSARHCGK